MWVGGQIKFAQTSFSQSLGGIGSEKMGCRELGTHVEEYLSKTEEVMAVWSVKCVSTQF